VFMGLSCPVLSSVLPCLYEPGSIAVAYSPKVGAWGWGSGHLPTLASARRSRCSTMLGRGSSFAHPNRYNVQGCDPPRLLELFGSSEVWFFCFFLFLPGLHTRFVWGGLGR
jgi:hypothetical protein